MSLLWCAAAVGQEAAPLAFEVASIKPARELKPGEGRGTRYLPTGIDFYASLRFCIGMAYRVRDYQISGPAWLRDATFEIIAKAPEGTNRKLFPDMMRTLLAERFKLVVHREQRELDGFALVVGKGGAKLTRTEARVDESGGFSVSSARMKPGGNGTMEYRANTMRFLAQNLAMLIGRPVVNETGIEGEYSLSLEFNRYDTADGDAIRAGSGSPGEGEVEPGMSVFASIQKYGLKLEARKIPSEVIVIDRIDRMPTEN